MNPLTNPIHPALQEAVRRDFTGYNHKALSCKYGLGLAHVHAAVNATAAPLADTPEWRARFHPMRHVLATLGTCLNLLGVVDGELAKAEDYLGDIVESGAERGVVGEAEELRLQRVSLQVQALVARLAELSELYRAKAGMV